MTPLEEQVEKLARAWDKDAEQIGGIRGDYAAGVSSTFQSAATQLRALLPLEVTDEMVERGARAFWEGISASLRGSWSSQNITVKDRYRHLTRACLSAALTQPQTERCPEDCDGFGRLIGDSDGPCPACSGLESDGGGAATAAGVADAEHERRLETNRLLWNRVARLEEALRVIRGPEDRGPWMLIYRNAGGGYAGLQAIAETALAPEDSEPSPYAKAFRERVCPVPEFPGIEKEES